MSRIAALGAITFVVVGLGACEKKDPPKSGGTPVTPAPAGDKKPEKAVASFPEKSLNRTTMPSGLIIEDLVMGTGETCLPKAVITCHFVGKLEDGTIWDSTYEKGDPQTAGLSQLMPGMQNGIVGMRVGGKRRLTMPPAEGFGPFGQQDGEGKTIVPPNATVICLIELLAVKQTLLKPGEKLPEPTDKNLVPNPIPPAQGKPAEKPADKEPAPSGTPKP